jgi:AraC-like DNA-binding protein
MINTLQLAKRKNLIQMSSDVITIVTVIINFKFNFKVLMLSKLEEEWSIKRLATHNGLNKSTVLQVINKEAGTRRDRE